VKTTAIVSVYTPLAQNVAGVLNKEQVIRNGAASAGPRAVSIGSPGMNVAISGQSGSYWRIGDNRYVPKSSVDIPATGISLNKNNATVSTKGTNKWLQLTANLTPYIEGIIKPTNDSVVWSSSNTQIATVDTKGKITGIATGSAVIFAENSGFRATCNITVRNIPVSTIKLNKTAITLLAGGKQKLSATVSPAEAYDKTLTWVSSHPLIATVSAQGEIKAIKTGVATISAISVDGSVRADCRVTVNTKPQPLPGSTSDQTLGTNLNMDITQYNSGRTKYKITFDYISYEKKGYLSITHPRAEYYVLKRRKTTEDSTHYKTLKSITPSSVTQSSYSYTDTTAKSSIRYVYLLQVYTKKGGTHIKSETVITGSGGGVNELKVKTKTDKSIALSWSRNANASGYRIYRSTDNINFNLVKTYVGSFSTSHFDTGLTANKTYYYRVHPYVKARWNKNNKYFKTTIHNGSFGSDKTSRPALNLYVAAFEPKVKCTIGFYKIAGAGYYALERRQSDGAYKFITSTSSKDKLTDKSTSTGEQHYCIVAYKKKGGAEITRAYITVRGAKPTKPVITYAANAGNDVAQIMLKWEKVSTSGLLGYKLYRSTDNKTFSYLMGLRDSTTSSLDQTVNYNKKYYYRIEAFKSEPKTSGLYVTTTYSKPSASKGVRSLKSAIPGNTRKYFKNEWKSAVDNSANNSKAVQFKLDEDSRGDVVLKIHLYMNFTGDQNEINAKKQSFINGVKTAWKCSVRTNNSNDFPYYNKKNKLIPIRFTTIVVTHDRGNRTKAEKKRKQQYMRINMSANCPVQNCTLQQTASWYHAHPEWLDGESLIFMPTDDAVADNINERYRNPRIGSAYGRTSSHEMGHILGLFDAYTDSNTNTVRLIANDETTRRYLDGTQFWHDTIMSNEHRVPMALPNDIEMMLFAYNRKVIKEQAYRKFSTYESSDKIIDKSDTYSDSHS
jgi:uncharacterized protein YjdB